MAGDTWSWTHANPDFPPSSTPSDPTDSIITVVAPGALEGDTSVPVTPLTVGLGIGDLLTFDTNKVVVVAAAASVDDEAITVEELPFDLDAGVEASFPIETLWSLSYSIRGASALTWSPSWVTTDGRQWTVTIPSTATAPLAAGTYAVQRHYTRSGARYTNSLPALEVKPNAATAAAGALQSFNEKMLAALASLLYPASGVISDVESYQIQSRAITKMNRLELQKWYDIYAARVRREKNGGRNPSIRIAFGNAR